VFKRGVKPVILPSLPSAGAGSRMLSGSARSSALAACQVTAVWSRLIVAQLARGPPVDAWE
jgi:hypothetical protein